MNTKIFTALTALAVITPLSALANSYDEKKNSSSSNFFNNDIFKDTYVSIGYGKSLPQGKLKGLTIDNNDEEFYIKKKLKNTNIFKTALGKKIDSLRVEFEFLHSKKHNLSFFNKNISANDTYSYKLHSTHYTYFINTYYDFQNLYSNLRPYVGLGIGFSRNKLSSESVSLNYSTNFLKSSKKFSNSFAWNASLGMIVDINEHLFLDFSYKYMDLGRAKGTPLQDPLGTISTDNNNIKGRFRNNVFLVSAGFKF
ncbi:porin family protein [Holosporaceae bacterium 'Namur']|nr:porin family protein [Holosporaceae bacterium 'Namur']